MFRARARRKINGWGQTCPRRNAGRAGARASARAPGRQATLPRVLEQKPWTWGESSSCAVGAGVWQGPRATRTGARAARGRQSSRHTDAGGSRCVHCALANTGVVSMCIHTRGCGRGAGRAQDRGRARRARPRAHFEAARGDGRGGARAARSLGRRAAAWVAAGAPAGLVGGGCMGRRCSRGRYGLLQKCSWGDASGRARAAPGREGAAAIRAAPAGRGARAGPPARARSGGAGLGVVGRGQLRHWGC